MKRDLQIVGSCPGALGKRLLLTICLGIALLSVVVTPDKSFAVLTEPDVVYFGTLTGGIDGSFLKLKRDDDGTTLASAVLSADGSYILRVPMDSVDPRTPGTARSGDEVSFYLGETVVRRVVIPQRGSMLNLSLAATPRTLEEWEALYPGDNGSGDMNRNGISDLQDFLNGNDPAACQWVTVDEIHLETTLYHEQVLQNCLNEAQNDGRHNLLKLTEGVYYGNFSYRAGADEEFDLRLIGGYDPAGSGERLTTGAAGTMLVGDTDKDEFKNGRVLDIVAGSGEVSSTVHIEGLRFMYGGTDWLTDTDRYAEDGLQGGGLRVQTTQADVELVGNLFSDNFAFRGGAMRVISSGTGSVLLVNNVISNNAAFQVGAVMISSLGSGAVTLVNNTIVENWAENEGVGDSVWIESSTAPVDLSNNIIRGTETWKWDIYVSKAATGDFPLTVRNNNMLPELAFATDIADYLLGVGNTTDNPRFLHPQTDPYFYLPTDGNYRLKANSPCLDQGVDHPALAALDADGNARFVGHTVDVGAYERPLLDDPLYLDPAPLHDPIVHTHLVAQGIARRQLTTNNTDYVINGQVEGPIGIKSLKFSTWEGEAYVIHDIPLNADNSFVYTLTLDTEGDNWFHFEVTKANDAKVSFWYVITLDTEPATATLATTAAAVTNAAPIPITLNFSKVVSDLAESDLVVTNGSVIAGTLAGSEQEYSFMVSPAGNGEVAIGLPAGATTDAAGNGNLVADQLVLVYDILPPTVILNSPVESSTYVSPIPVEVTFSEAVTGFSADSLILHNGTLSNFSANNGGYTFNVTPTAFDVLVSVDVAGGAVHDVAGNASSPALQLARHYGPPIVSEPNLPKTSVSVPGGYYQTGITLSMTATDGAAIYFTLDGSMPSIASPRYTAPLAIATTTTLRYFAMDVAGNREAQQTLSYVIDAELPVLELSALADGRATNNSTLNLTGRVSDNSGVATLRINGVDVGVDAAGGFNLVATLQSGANQIVTTVIDLAGNEVQDRRTITLDQLAPTLLVTSPADNSKTANERCEISGTTDENAFIEVKVNAQVGELVSLNGTLFTGTVDLAVGLNTIEITATDPAGNVSTVKRSVTYDNQEPTLAIVEPNQDLQTNQARVLIKGSVADSQSAVLVTVNDNPVTLEPDGTFEWLIEFAHEGSFTVLVKALDEAGHVTVVQRNIIYDATVPVFTIDSVLTPTNDRSQTFSGNREAGVSIVVACATATVGGVTYPTAESWRVELSEFAIGLNRITVTGSDAAGNNAIEAREITVGNFYNGPKTITFNAPPGMDIYYTTDGTTPTTGSLQYFGPLTLTETTTFSYFAIDSQGNRSQVTSTVYTIDTTAPTVAIVSLSDGLTADNTTFVYAIRGTVGDNTRVESLTINDVFVPFASDGSFSADVVLRDGRRTIVVEAMDMVGNGTTETRTIDPATAMIDLTAPELVVAQRPASLVKETTAEIAFSSSDPTATFECRLDRELFTGCSSPRNYTRLSDGPHSFSVRAVDPVGNTSTAQTLTWITDTTAPAITVSTLSGSAATSVSPLNVAGTVTDANVIGYLTINGLGVPLSVDGAFSFALPLANEGDIVVTVVATDAAGNQTIDSRTITYDLDLPVLAISSPADNSRTTEATLRVTGTMSPTGTVTIRNITNNLTVTGDVTGTGFSGTIQLEPGLNTIEVSASDAAGNPFTTLKRSVLYDPLSPSLAITEPAQDTELHLTATIIRGTVTEATGTAVILEVNGISYTPLVTAGQFEQAITLPAEPGSFQVVVTATDAIGSPPSTVVRNIIYTPIPGDTDGDGVTTSLEELLKAFQYVSGQRNLTARETELFDCAPLGVDGKPNPDGVVTVADVILMLRRIVGLVSW